MISCSPTHFQETTLEEEWRVVRDAPITTTQTTNLLPQTYLTQRFPTSNNLTFLACYAPLKSELRALLYSANRVETISFQAMIVDLHANFDDDDDDDDDRPLY